jgi:hypothetical protein
VTEVAARARAWAWLILLVAGTALPALTWTERATFVVGNQALNWRVALYFALAVIAALGGIACLPIVARRRPPAVLAGLAFLAWVLLSVAVAGQPVREWLPTVVRLALYVAALAIGYAVGWMSPGGQRFADRPRGLLLPLAALAATAIPSAAAVWELVRGTAPMLNGAPRISGSLPGHPVAFSLVLVMGGLMAVTLITSTRRPVVLAILACVEAILVALVALTFTRLALLVGLAGSVAIMFLTPAFVGVRAMRVGSTILVAVAVLVLAVPVFTARSANSQPLSVVFPEPPQPAASAVSAPALPNVDPADIEVDNSTLLRVILTERGIGYVSASPILGHGPGSFDRLFEADTGRAGVAAHDDLLLFAVEEGIPGLVLYVLVLGLIAWRLRPWRLRSDLLGAVATGTLVTLLALTLGAAFHNPTYFPELMVIPWLAAGTCYGWLSMPATAQP